MRRYVHVTEQDDSASFALVYVSINGPLKVLVKSLV